ncbi:MULTISPECIES: protein-disulfide reductase DsbD [unclassified Herbaspirillum]|uniref:protein-disulfide reductase DsbD n=1 Tax=unclassified Herbaspirillum TaxID=2624150 RepID=UPI000E2EE6BE|nr:MULTISPECIES: protein-disulfide reductase DsbD [unclassified Herbaspirillum]RFB67597.1 protein-disulfide reductase DsbD [Herbaspirillum sp. 3R-3a1]TFI05206.1 protein-disulfide reductase DsbD [Herbaspirillum sp. 3R11]TFI12464.1 protein-disulfide reductase DsbD [Herbaspirillum sp. 3R-11]
MFKRLLVAVRGGFLMKLWLAAMLTISLTPASASAEEYLAPEAAFRFSAVMVDAGTLQITYAIADGYYMYRDRFHFKADGATLGQPDFPHGKVKYDENFQKEVETYRNSVSIRIPVEVSTSPGAFKLVSTAQGCADKGLCYPPMDTVVDMSASAVGKVVGPADASGNVIASSGSDMDRITAALRSGKLLTVLSLFFLLGVGLSFTPCVLPMVPILSSIIVGEGAQAKRGRGLLLSAVYVLGMALVYTALGIAAGLIGEGLSAVLQNPWVLSAFALLMVGLSLSMFNFYQLQIPAAWQSKLTEASGQGGGKLAGVFVMGAISALIVGPCVAAPLAGALLYISQTRDVVLGGSALFAMALGMGVPLLVIGASAGALLPRAGGWMESVKRFFGVLMLATALWMVSPVIPAWAFVAGWAALGIAYGAYLLWSKPGHWAARACGLAFAALGLLQLVSVATGGRDPLAPLSHLGGGKPAAHTDFVRVRSVAELDAALAQTGGKPAMLDFYADWCVSCKEMEKFTFTDPRVREKFARMVLLQIDVTANNADDKAMLKRFQLFGPPGIILFDGQGRELADKRVIGYQNADQFLQSLQALAP